jgi:hypothetical protein
LDLTGFGRVLHGGSGSERHAVVSTQKGFKTRISR